MFRSITGMFRKFGTSSSRMFTAGDSRHWRGWENLHFKPSPLLQKSWPLKVAPSSCFTCHSPIFSGNISDFNESNGVPMTPFDSSGFFDPGSEPITSYSLVGGPGWMSIDVSTGIISGTPDAIAVTAGVTVEATNIYGTTSSNAFSVTVV